MVKKHGRQVTSCITLEMSSMDANVQSSELDMQINYALLTLHTPTQMKLSFHSMFYWIHLNSLKVFM